MDLGSVSEHLDVYPGPDLDLESDGGFRTHDDILNSGKSLNNEYSWFRDR
jgi:hypothetical protein